MAGQRNVMDPRNSLVFEFRRLVLEVSPKTFVMENVPGLLSMVTAEGVPVIHHVVPVARRLRRLPGATPRTRLRPHRPRRGPRHRLAPSTAGDADDCDDVDQAEQLDLFGADA